MTSDVSATEQRAQLILEELLRAEKVSVAFLAKRLKVSEATVRTQVKSILAKLEVSSQLAAVGLAYQVGWRAPYDLPLRS